MENNSYLQRTGALIVTGIKAGVVSSLVSSIIYAILILGWLIFIEIVVLKGSETDKVSTIIAILFFIGIYALIAGVFPSLIIGLLGGACIGLFLSFWREKINPVLAGFIGLVIGTTLVLIADYWSWTYSRTYSIQSISFFQFLLWNKADYLIPSLLALPISFYVGWKTNSMNVSEINPATQG